MDTLTEIHSTGQGDRSSSAEREYVDTLRDDDFEDDEDIATRDTLPEIGQARRTRAGGSSHPPPPTLRAEASEDRSIGVEEEVLRRLPAWRIMRQGLVTVRPWDSLEKVAALLWESRVGCVPVTLEDGTLVGIITEGDFVHLTHHGEFARHASRDEPNERPPR